MDFQYWESSRHRKIDILLQNLDWQMAPLSQFLSDPNFLQCIEKKGKNHGWPDLATQTVFCCLNSYKNYVKKRAWRNAISFCASVCIWYQTLGIFLSVKVNFIASIVVLTFSWEILHTFYLYLLEWVISGILSE